MYNFKNKKIKTEIGKHLKEKCIIKALALQFF